MDRYAKTLYPSISSPRVYVGISRPCFLKLTKMNSTPPFFPLFPLTNPKPVPSPPLLRPSPHFSPFPFKGWSVVMGSGGFCGDSSSSLFSSLKLEDLEKFSKPYFYVNNNNNFCSLFGLTCNVLPIGSGTS